MFNKPRLGGLEGHEKSLWMLLHVSSMRARLRNHLTPTGTVRADLSLRGGIWNV